MTVYPSTVYPYILAGPNHLRVGGYVYCVSEAALLFQNATVRMRFVRGTPSGAESVVTVSCTRNGQRGVSCNPN